MVRYFESTFMPVCCGLWINKTYLCNATMFKPLHPYPPGTTSCNHKTIINLQSAKGSVIAACLDSFTITSECLESCTSFENIAVVHHTIQLWIIVKQLWILYKFLNFLDTCHAYNYIIMYYGMFVNTTVYNIIDIIIFYTWVYLGTGEQVNCCLTDSPSIISCSTPLIIYSNAFI